MNYIDGIEVYNRGNKTEEMNEKAKQFAFLHPHLIQTSGGDAHRPNEVAFGGIQTKRRMKTLEELVACLRENNYQLS